MFYFFSHPQRCIVNFLSSFEPLVVTFDRIAKSASCKLRIWCHLPHLADQCKAILFARLGTPPLAQSLLCSSSILAPPYPSIPQNSPSNEEATHANSRESVCELGLVSDRLTQSSYSHMAQMHEMTMIADRSVGMHNAIYLVDTV